MSSQEGVPAALPEASDVLVSTAAALVNLAGIRLTEKEHRNLPKAKEAIDSARQLLALCPEDAVAPIKDALAQVQLLYVKEQGPEGRPPGASDPGQEQSERERAEREEREKARAKIWTPPGA
jgi:hypothetical protein